MSCIINFSKAQAKRDAAEFAKAKVSFGEGSGTRRKLIKEQVRSRSVDPEYAKYFTAYLAKEDMGKLVTEAKQERAIKDAAQGLKKVLRYVWPIIRQVSMKM